MSVPNSQNKVQREVIYKCYYKSNFQAVSE